MPRPERRSHGCHTGCGARRLKAGSRRRRERDSASLEPVIDAADPSAITSTLELQDSHSLRSTIAVHPTERNTSQIPIDSENLPAWACGQGEAKLGRRSYPSAITLEDANL
jgi:hypothetical protein